jgi:dolichyl-diphosphooligosaccharide--protein glycosyltransferase
MLISSRFAGVCVVVFGILLISSLAFDSAYGEHTKVTKKTTTAKKDLVKKPTTTKSKGNTAKISTAMGDIEIKLKPDVAPKTVENFKKLAKSKFYDGTLFHRIIPNFMIQGGDPNTKTSDASTWGYGGPDYTINAEISDLKHTKYMVSMARGQDINSAGSQFFIMVGDAPWLDGQYAIFGEVTKGQGVIDKISLLQTNEFDQPVDIASARIKSIRIK